MGFLKTSFPESFTPCEKLYRNCKQLDREIFKINFKDQTVVYHDVYHQFA